MLPWCNYVTLAEQSAASRLLNFTQVYWSILRMLDLLNRPHRCHFRGGNYVKTFR